MKIEEFIRDTVYGGEVGTKWCSSVLRDGDGNLFSYGIHYPLCFKVKFSASMRVAWVLNIEGYSQSTARHIYWASPYVGFKVKIPAGYSTSDFYSRREQFITETWLKEYADISQALLDVNPRARKKIEGLLFRRREIMSNLKELCNIDLNEFQKVYVKQNN